MRGLPNRPRRILICWKQVMTSALGHRDVFITMILIKSTEVCKPLDQLSHCKLGILVTVKRIYSIPSCSPINPFINLSQSRIALAATGAARSRHRQFSHFAFADPFAQHTAQGTSIHTKVIGQIRQSNPALLL